jgi:hypothetical protein
VSGKQKVFSPYIGGLPICTQKIDDIAQAGYRGFEFGQ